MKIHGKTFDEIYQLLPWQYKLVVVAGSAFLLFIVLHFAMMLFTPGADKTVRPIDIRNLGMDTNIFDPSMDADPATGKAYMVFTSLHMMDSSSTPLKHPAIRLADAALPCKTWVADNYIFDPSLAEIQAPDGQSAITSGYWRYETPSIVFDPDDPGHEWKVYAYRYLWNKENTLPTMRRYSAIVSVSSPGPDKGWGETQWALSAAPDYPPAPYGALVAAHISAMDPSLANITLFTRPSVVYADGVLLMSLSAFADNSSIERIILLASTDHGRSWKYLGTPLTVNDAPLVKKHKTLSGASLLKQKGQIYMAAVFGSAETAADGTFIFSFADISKGLLARDASGAPAPVKELPRNSIAPTSIGGGFAAYNDGCMQGIVTGEYSGLKGIFQLFQTHQDPSGK